MKVLSPVHFNPNAGTHPKHGGSGSSGGGYSPWAPSYDTWGYRFPVTLGSTGIVETDKGFPFLVPARAGMAVDGSDLRVADALGADVPTILMGSMVSGFGLAVKASIPVTGKQLYVYYDKTTTAAADSFAKIHEPWNDLTNVTPSGATPPSVSGNILTLTGALARADLTTPVACGDNTIMVVGMKCDTTVKAMRNGLFGQTPSANVEFQTEWGGTKWQLLAADSGSLPAAYSDWVPANTWQWLVMARYPDTNLVLAGLDFKGVGNIDYGVGVKYLDTPFYSRISASYCSNACATNTFVLKNDNVSVTNRQYSPVFVFETGQRPPLVTFGESEAHA